MACRELNLHPTKIPSPQNKYYTAGVYARLKLFFHSPPCSTFPGRPPHLNLLSLYRSLGQLCPAKLLPESSHDQRNRLRATKEIRRLAESCETELQPVPRGKPQYNSTPRLPCSPQKHSKPLYSFSGRQYPGNQGAQMRTEHQWS